MFSAEYNYSQPPMSPMTMLRQSPTDPKWFDDNVNDFSLSSFLGHLETACDLDKKSSQIEVKYVILMSFFWCGDISAKSIT